MVLMSAAAGYATSQLAFPGLRVLWWRILASFMVPNPARTVNHFVFDEPVETVERLVRGDLAAAFDFGHSDDLQAVDGVPQAFRGTAVMDRGTQMQPLFHLYLPMNGGIITALAFITFII